MKEKRNIYGFPQEDRAAVMFGILMVGVSAGVVLFVAWWGFHSWR